MDASEKKYHLQILAESVNQSVFYQVLNAAFNQNV